MTTPLSFTLELTDSDETLEKTFEEYIEDMEQLQPVEIIATSSHAMYLEYGSGPASKNSSNKGNSADGLSVKQEIRKWVEVRFPTMGRTEKDKFAYNVYRKIMTKGTTPHPYMRPAIKDVLMSTDLENWLDEGKTVEDLGNRIADRMKEYLRNGEDGESHIYQWEVYNSIKVYKATDPRAILLGTVEDGSGQDIISMVDRVFEERY